MSCSNGGFMEIRKGDETVFGESLLDFHLYGEVIVM